MRKKLCGEVTNNGWARVYRYFGYEACCPNDIRQALEECPEEEELVLEINSGGGSVYAGFEMYNLIRSSGRKVKAEIQSLAASAMSVVTCACNPVMISPAANMMIHRSSVGGTRGNEEDHRQRAQMLHTIDETFLNAYEEKASGKSTRVQLRHMIENETFLTPEQAVACGLADGILERNDGAEQGSDALNPMLAVASMGEAGINKAVFAMLQRPSVEDMVEAARQEGLNIDCPEPDSVQNTTQEEGETKMEVQDINTMEELNQALPELTATIRAEAAKAERERIIAIDALSMTGFEGIVDAAKADPAQTAGSVAIAIITAQKKQEKAYLKDAKSDADSGGVNGVKGESAPEKEEEDPVAAAKAAAARFKKGGVK